MKKIILILALFIVTLPASAEPLSVQTDQGTGFVNIATPSFDVTGLTNLGAYIPEGVKVIYISVYGGDLVIGDKNDIATGTMPTGVVIASGTVNLPIDGISPLPGRVLNIWALPSTATVSVRLAGWQ